MIQRVQTVWLVLGAAVFGGAVRMSGFVPGMGEWLDMATPAAFAVAAVVSLVAVFLYGNRRRQRAAILGAQYVALAGLGLLVLAMAQVGVSAASDAFTQMSWIALMLPVAGFLLMRFARRGVEADIKLLESVDRLR